MNGFTPRTRQEIGEMTLVDLQVLSHPRSTSGSGEWIEFSDPEELAVELQRRRARRAADPWGLGEDGNN